MSDPIADFERAWRAGDPPDVADLLPLPADTLRELVMIDLEFRWRRYADTRHDWLGPDPPLRLEEYAARLPLAIDADLIGEEFRARHVWGDRPAVAEYLARFPDLAATLSRGLPALAAELAPGPGPTPQPRLPDAPPPADDDLPALGPYQLLARLGAGATGTVFRAAHADTGAVVAVKVLRPELLADRDAVARFDREARLLAGLSHPNLLRLIGVERVGGRVGLVTELLAGPTLAERVRSSGPLPVTDVERLFADAAAGLAFVHSAGLVHRDVTPANLMADAGGRTKLLDLGLAKLRADGAAAGPPGSPSSWLTPQGVALLGTPDYLAPELAADVTAAGPTSDLYSLGCVLVFALTGSPPYPGGTAFEKMVRHAVADVPDVTAVRPDVPPPLAAAVARLLSKSPADRAVA